VRPGDKVYVPTQYLQHADVVQLDDSIKLMIAERDIAIVW
jgi:hypothetical protein